MYLRLGIQGSLPSGEVWSVNPVFHFNAALSPVWDQASAEAIVAALITGLPEASWPASLRSHLSSSGRITGFRLEGRDESDDLLGVAEAQYGSPVGGLQQMTKPLQSAVVLSLRTSTPGARGRGRLYWPSLGSTLSSVTGRFDTPTALATAQGAVTLLSAVQEIIEDNAGVFPWTDVLLGVRSRTDGVTRTVTAIGVGDALDTQRRRRDKLPETYSMVTFP